MTVPRLLNVSEAAARVGLSKSTLDKLRVYGDGPQYAKLGRAVRYAEADLVVWVEAAKRPSTSAAASSAR